MKSGLVCPCHETFNFVTVRTVKPNIQWTFDSFNLVYQVWPNLSFLRDIRNLIYFQQNLRSVIQLFQLVNIVSSERAKCFACSNGLVYPFLGFDRGGGVGPVVGVLTFFSDDPSSNLSDVFGFSVKCCWK